ncbi:MAG TPA: S8 family serine peptidase, partial [Luteolibacter sp.]|nr:S8 family serine peptidase [Luteolibacter sp.]
MKRPPNRPTSIDDAKIVPVKFTNADQGVAFSVAMDEICVKGADGAESFVTLDPPATPENYRLRIAAFSAQGEVLPVAYPDGEERNDANRRLITRKMRVKVPADATDKVAAANGLAISERPGYAPEWVILEAADPLAALAAVDSVRASEGVVSADVLTGRKRFTRAMPNDALINNQWHLKNTVTSPSISHANVEGAWNYPSTGIRGNGIRIGIVDDGLQTGHPDLSPNVDTVNGWDWNGNDADPNPSATANADRHGTACAGVAGARGNNSIGVSGVAPEATLVGMRLIAGSPTDADEASALSWKNDIIQVKSNSWGPSDYIKILDAPDPLAAAAFQNMATNGRGGKGTIFTWAAGNGGGATYQDNSNFDGYANSIYTIAVAALERTGLATDYTEPGANILITAPSGDRDTIGTTTTDRTGTAGYNTLSTPNGGDYYSSFDGTSSATPVVSGAVALMLQKNPNLGWRDVQEILFRSATKVVPSDAGWKTNGAGFSFHHQFGGGLVNATAAVNMAEAWVNLPAQTSLVSTDSAAVAIPNNNAAGASKTFTFSQINHRVEAVTVQLAATHSARGNLAITLTSPSGTVS